MPILKTSLFNILALSTVPCTAVGASAYIGYKQFYKSASQSDTSPAVIEVKNTESTNSELVVDLQIKQQELDNLKSLLKNQQSLLATDELEKIKLENELIHFEIASNTKAKQDIEAKLSTFVGAFNNKETHEKAIQITTQEKDEAESAKTQKQALVDAKKEEIKTAEQAYTKQQQVEAEAKQKAESSTTAFNVASTAYTEKETLESAAQEAFTANEQEIETHWASISEKEKEKSALDAQKSTAVSNAENGKATCNDAIKTEFEGKTCEDELNVDGKEEIVVSEIAKYQLLKKAIADIVEKLSTLNNSIKDVKDLLANSNGEKSSLQSKLDAAKQEASTSKKAKDTSEAQKNTDCAAYEKEKNTTQELEQKHTEVQNQLKPLQANLESATITYNNLANKLAELISKTSDIETKYNDAKADLATVIDSFSTKEAAENAVKTKTQALQDKIDDKTKLAGSSLPPTTLNNKTLQEINDSITSHQDALIAIEEKIRGFKVQISTLNNNISTVSADITNLSTEIKNTKQG